MHDRSLLLFRFSSLLDLESSLEADTTLYNNAQTSLTTLKTWRSQPANIL